MTYMAARLAWTKYIILGLTTLAVTPVLAQPDFSNFKLNAYPVLSFGGGAAYTTQGVGQSQYFPIVDPATDQFYNYQASSGQETEYLFNAYLGNEWLLPKNFAAQLGLDYTQSTHFDAGGTLTQGADAHSQSTASYNYDIISHQVLIAAKLFYQYKILHPYIMAGAGWAFNTTSNLTTGFPPNLTFTRSYQSANTSSFSYSVGVGVEIQLATSIRLGVGYRFADLGTSSLGKATVNSIPVNGTLSSQHLCANEVMAVLTFYPFDTPTFS
jgi:opacity protein-like surface antigen